MDRGKAQRLKAGFLRRVDPERPVHAVFDYQADLYFWVKDAAGVFVSCSRPFSELVGAASEDDVVGRRDQDFFPVHLCENYAQDDAAVIKTGKPMVDRVELIRNSDGTINWFGTTKIPVFGRGDKVIAVAGVTRDLKKTMSSTVSLTETAPAIEEMVSNYEGPVSIAKLAKRSGLSLSQFERRFKKRFGTTPRQYLMRVRIDAACQLLTTTDASVAQIAAETGFCDQSHLTHQFTRAKSMSPMAYRRMHEGTPVGPRRWSPL